MKHLINISFGLLTFLLPATPAAIAHAGIDSLYINEVEVRQDRKMFHSAEFRSYQIKSALIRQNMSLNLGEFLGRTGSLNMRGYGSPGSLVTVSMRGTASAHTQVNWNGFPLNAPTTGIADLSTIPVFLFDNISVIYGGSGSIYGSGSLGGVINVGNDINWDRSLSVMASIDAGSFGYLNGGFRIKAGNSRIQYSLASYLQDSENDFIYTENISAESPRLRMKHNETGSFGLLQDVNIRLARYNFLQLGTWYQVKKKNIPEILGSPGESLQEQSDSSLKFFARWKKLGTRSSFELRSIYFSDYLSFLDKTPAAGGEYLVDSEIMSEKYSVDANYRYYFSSGLSLDIGANYSLLNADVKAYGKKVREGEGNIIGALSYRTSRLDLATSLRLNFNAYEQPPPLYSLSAKYRFAGESAWLRTHVSSKYRLPGLNDKYWKPGGDPELLPEKGWGADIGAGMNIDILDLDLHLFTNRVKNQIQWVPDALYYVPLNHKEVWSRGLESSAAVCLERNSTRLDLSLDYSMTFASIISSGDLSLVGKQLSYTPYHIARGNAHFELKSFFTELETSFTSRRYTTADNDEFYSLDPYFLVNASIGYQPGNKLKGSMLRFRINNAFDTEYRMINAYPVPGRTYMISLLMNINIFNK